MSSFGVPRRRCFSREQRIRRVAEADATDVFKREAMGRDIISLSIPRGGLRKAFIRHMASGLVAWRMQLWCMSVMALITREGAAFWFREDMILSPSCATSASLSIMDFVFLTKEVPSLSFTP